MWDLEKEGRCRKGVGGKKGWLANIVCTWFIGEDMPIVAPIGILVEMGEPIVLEGIVCIIEVGEENVGPYPGGKIIVLVAYERPVELIPEVDILDEVAIRV